MSNNNISKLTPEMLVPRMGEYIVQKGMISEDDLQKVLSFQQEQARLGKPYMLGQALLELKMLDRDSLDQVITEQLIQLRTELSKMKANFVANISHELRTPLTHIKGYLELLITESLGPIVEEQHHALEISQKSATRLGTLIDDLITFSLASRGEMSMKLVKADIGRIISLVAKSALSKAEERGVQVIAVVPENIPQV